MNERSGLGSTSRKCTGNLKKRKLFAAALAIGEKRAKQISFFCKIKIYIS
jgi:hypothetical protein